ncbi:MAG: NUDIX hydrolase [Phycisphaerales bacterium]|jgi:ADP-ribose pyrophosphatase|nr:NUDIX hydrolase [Phycisphaerales bacterium]
MSFELIEKQRLYEGKKISLEVHHLQDDEGHRARREVVVHPGAVVVLPFLSTDRIILIRNRRYAAGQILVELPAGTLNKGEDPMNCAGRELQEETGYLAGRLQRLGAFYSSPGILSEKLYTFAAYDLERTATALDEDEEIEVMEVSFNQSIEMIREGQIIDAKTIATLLMYERFNWDVLRGIK